jgi:hypothetical protein
LACLYRQHDGADAILNRIASTSHRIEFKGESMRRVIKAQTDRGRCLSPVISSLARGANLIGRSRQLEWPKTIGRVATCTSDSEVAASRYGASANGVFIYDRISTRPLHRRRRVGSAIMMLLSDAHDGSKTVQALVATDEGRLLLEKLGWVARSPWATALIIGPDAR